MFRVTTRALVQPRPNNFKHYYVYPTSKEEKHLALMPYRKQRFGRINTETPNEEHISRKLSYILRHNAIKQGINMRKDGYVKVTELLAIPYFHSIDFMTLERVVAKDNKKRYTLLHEPETSAAESVWWIRANQGHSIKIVEIDMIPVTSPSQVPMAVHGTTKKAWERIAVEGLSRMTRQHVHFAQGIPGSGVISGMRTTSEVYIFLNIPMALKAGLKLLISSNEVVCCPGNEDGFVNPRFFSRVEWAGNRQAIPGWNKPREFLSETNLIKEDVSQSSTTEEAGSHDSVMPR